MHPTDRAEINRESAQHSTGPKTEEGKQRSKYNARRHNLTGQTIIGTAEEMAIYAGKCQALHADLRPEGEFERSLVQSLADSQFQLDRARAIETNLFFELSIQRLPSSARGGGDPEDSDPTLDWARAQARAFLENGKHFDLLGRYANRFHRQVIQLQATLFKVQKERRAYDQRRNEQRKQRQAEALAEHQNQAASRTHHSPKSKCATSSTGLPPCDSTTQITTGFVSHNPTTGLNPERQRGDRTPKTLGEIALANLKNQAA